MQVIFYGLVANVYLGKSVQKLREIGMFVQVFNLIVKQS